LIITTVRR